jgi:hypothetical protein
MDVPIVANSIGSIIQFHTCVAKHDTYPGHVQHTASDGNIFWDEVYYMHAAQDVPEPAGEGCTLTYINQLAGKHKRVHEPCPASRLLGHK